MFSKLQFVIIFILILSMVDAKRCDSCCSCSSQNARANKFKKDFDKSSQENGMLKSKTITLGDNFALSVSTKDGTHIGWIHDEFNPSMSIPANAQIRIEKRGSCSNGTRIFYDIDHKGLFIDLPVIGRYTASQISLPAKSVSSIIIPTGYQVVLYANDDFSGNNFIVLTSSQKNLGNFNDRMVSLEIQEIFEKKAHHVAIVNSHTNFNGKKTGIQVGGSYEISIQQIGSISIEPEHEVFIYDGSVLTDIYTSSMSCIAILGKATATVQVQKVGNIPTQYAVFYDDVDYSGAHFILLNPTVYNWTVGKLSSLRIPEDYQVVLRDRDSHIVLRGNVPNLVLYFFNDRAMTMVYEKRTAETIENVVIFSKANFYGEMRTLPFGNTNVSEDFYAGSIRVPSGYRVQIVREPVFPFNAERTFTYVADSSDIGGFFDTAIRSVHISQSEI
jgi:hypothetical protein